MGFELDRTERNDVQLLRRQDTLQEPVVEPTEQQRVADGGVGRAGSTGRLVRDGGPVLDGKLGRSLARSVGRGSARAAFKPPRILE
jgi:hypothetical protein